MRVNAIANTPLSWWNGATEKARLPPPAHRLNMPVCFRCANRSDCEIASEKVEASSERTGAVEELWRSCAGFVATQWHPLVFFQHYKQELKPLTPTLNRDNVLDWTLEGSSPKKLAKKTKNPPFLRVFRGDGGIHAALIFKTNSSIKYKEQPVWTLESNQQDINTRGLLQTGTICSYMAKTQLMNKHAQWFN